jgi:hypothetical protein
MYLSIIDNFELQKKAVEDAARGTGQAQRPLAR